MDLPRPNPERWVSYDREKQPLPEFLTQWKPSTIFHVNIEWLCVSRLKAHQKKGKPDTLGLIAAWQTFCIQKKHRVTGEDLLSLATLHNVILGKWMIFIPTQDVDYVWGVLASAVMAGQLGDDVKVSTHSQQKSSKMKVGSPVDAKSGKNCDKPGLGNHVICVYSANFEDLDGVFYIRSQLRSLGITQKLTYKPDAYTFCGVYSGNPWSIRPVIYRE